MADTARERAAALELLGLEQEATPAEVAAAYRRLARSTHPDRCPDGDAAARFAALTDAYRRARVAPEPPPAAEAPRPAVRRARPSPSFAPGFAPDSRGPDLVAGPVHVVPWPRSGRPRGTGEEPG